MNYLKNLKLNKKNSTFILSVFLLVFIGVLGDVSGAHADIFGLKDFLNKGVFMIVGGFLGIIIALIGVINNLVVSSIVSVSSYNNFINETSIVMAWSLIRDFCNMFFILILLVIAFATILRIESYNMKKWLPKLLIMAVLINFSRTIAGLIIDFSQVFMLTFVSAIGSTGGDYMNSLGVDKYFNFIKGHVLKSDTKDADMPNIITSLALGTLFLIIAVIVLIVVLAILIIRMVMIWIYVVLSPLAFLLAAFPGGQKYSSRWWDEFIKNVITGPILMFFVWLALISANSFSKFSIGTNNKSFGISEMSRPDQFIHFIVAIGMLIGGLIITSQAGGAAGGMASTGMGAINKGKSFALKKTGAGAAKTAKFAGRKTLSAGRQADRLMGNRFKMQGGLVGTGLQKTANAITFAGTRNKWREKREEKSGRHDVWVQYQKAMKEEPGEKRAEALAKITYRHKDKDYKVNNEGRFYTEDKAGNKVVNGKIKKLSDWEAKRYEASHATNSAAWSASNTARDRKIEKEKESLQGYSEAMLHVTAKDGSLSKSKRQAAASMLGEKQSFIDGADEKEIKNLHEMLEGKAQDDFKDSVIKRNASKILDKSTEEGKKDYEKAIRKGKVDDDLSESELESGALDLIKNVSKAKYSRILNNAKETDKKVAAATKGLEKSLEVDPHVVKNGIINPIRKEIANLNNDLSIAFKGLNTSEMTKGVHAMLSTMSASQVSSLNTNNFKTFNQLNKNERKERFNDDQDRAREFNEALVSGIEKKMNDDPRWASRAYSSEGDSVGYIKTIEENKGKNNSNKEKKGGKYHDEIGSDRDD